MDKKELKKKIEDGWIHTQVVFEMIGNPKAHVEKTIRGYIELMHKDPQLEVLNVEYGEPEEKDNLWSTFADAEVLVHGMEKFTEICFNNMPATIEILKPSELTFGQKDLTLWLNDLLSKLHEASAHAQKINAANKMLQQNINALVFNSIMFGLETPKTTSEIAKSLGLPKEKIEPFLSKLAEEKKILKKAGKYSKK